MANIIALLTDFGISDPFVGVMKGVILSINPKATIVDLAHNIPKFDIRYAAFMLRTSYKYFPRGTIFCVVVDPGVGTQRRPIVVETRNYYFVGPDNGCLAMAIKEDGVLRVFIIENRKYMLRNISTTFHGRDIFAPISAYLSLGVNPSEFGRSVDPNTLEEMVMEDYAKHDDYYEAEVICHDSFGNIFLNMPTEALDEPAGSTLEVMVRDKMFRAKVARTYGDGAEGELLILRETSHGFVEIAVNMGSAARLIGVRPKEKIRIIRRH